jgi:hypothetical protein
MQPAVAYVRVSTREQGHSGLGLDAQRAALARFAEQEQFNIIATFTEVASAKGDEIERRPQLKAALQPARKAKAPVLVAKLDRLSRDVHFISGLMAHRVPFIVSEIGPRVEQSEITKAEALQRAESLRRVFEELSGLSARATAEELNRRGIPTAGGGKAVQVIRVRNRHEGVV